MSDLVGTWECLKCGEFIAEAKLRRDGCCPVCCGEVEIIKPAREPELTGIEREFGISRTA